jgi:NarL family two-component system sensor histidine kinase LiaS
MFRSLWFKFSACFTVLIFIALCILDVIPIYVFGSVDSRMQLIPPIVREAVTNEELVIAQLIKEKSATRWQDLLKRRLSDKLVNIQMSNEYFHLTGILEPNIYYRVFDNQQNLIFSEPAVLPDKALNALNSATSINLARQPFEWQQIDQGYFGISAPIADSRGEIQGHIDLLFIAERTPLGGYLITFTDNWFSIILSILTLSFIGGLCGAVAAWFVTRRIRQMNKVTSSWRQGNFMPRIAVSRWHNDVLTEHSRHLNAMADDLSSLFSLRQIMATTEERNRVARELHDTVKQNLFALNLQLAAVKLKNQAPEMREHIIEAENITREAQSDLIEILTQLHPPTQEEGQFYHRIDVLSEDIRKRFDVEVKWQKKESVILTPTQEHALIRVAQESISNAIRHGKASEIIMNLFCDGEIIHWLIKDNGVGLSGGKNQLGLGLISMRERVNELPDGKFSIDANGDEGGVVISVEWRANV